MFGADCEDPATATGTVRSLPSRSRSRLIHRKAPMLGNRSSKLPLLKKKRHFPYEKQKSGSIRQVIARIDSASRGHGSGGPPTPGASTGRTSLAGVLHFQLHPFFFGDRGRSAALLLLDLFLGDGQLLLCLKCWAWPWLVDVSRMGKYLKEY